MKQNKSYNLFTFYSLYIAQSIPMSFFATALPILMRQGDYTLTTIALTKLIKLPWMLKFIWSPFVDNKTETLKDYKQWIIVSESIYAVFIFAIIFLNLKTDLFLVVILLLLAFISSATQDIATDAMAARAFERKDNSLINSIQSMGSFTGSMVGSGLLIILMKKIGITGILPWLVVFVIAAILPLIFNKNISLRRRTTIQKARPQDVISFFKQKNIGYHILYLVLYYAALIGILGVMSPMMVDLGFDMHQIGFMVGVVGISMGIASSFATGIFIKKYGNKNVARFVSAFMIITPLFFWWIDNTSQTSYAVILIAILLLWGTYGMSSTVINSSAMLILRDGREGTDFTMQIVITHLTAMFIAIGCAKVGDIFGYGSLFLLELAIAIVSFSYVMTAQPFKKSILINN